MKLLIFYSLLLLSNCNSGIYGKWRIVDVSIDKPSIKSPLENSVVNEKALEKILGSEINIQRDSISMVIAGKVVYRSPIDKITENTIVVTENGKSSVLKYSRLDGRQRYMLEQPDGTRLIVEKE